MSRAPLVGIVGAAGAVGREASRLLAREGSIGLRLGTRRPTSIGDLPPELAGDDVEVRALDLYDANALDDFCDGCRVIVSCAAPSFRILDLVARAAFAAGADYVDPGGDHPLHAALSHNLPPRGRTALVTAGMMPGLSALLLRWLARRGFDRAHRVTAYVGGRGRLTSGTAGDYLLSLGGGAGEPNAAWRDGARVPRALPTLADVELPFFPGRVTAQPFISAETERMAHALGVREIHWYNVFDGAHMLAALRRLGPMPSGDGFAGIVSELSAAADLDMFGTSTYQMFVITLEGEAGADHVVQTLVFRATDAHALTATVTALSVVALLNSDVGPGVHYAGEALPADLVDRIVGMPAVLGVEMFDGVDTSMIAIEDAAL
jgi:hypothetical protein